VTGPLTPDASQLATFHEALFRYADSESYVSLRVFPDRGAKGGAAVHVEGVRAGAENLLTAAARVATKAARWIEPAVFAPPVATFTNAERAAERDLANGLTLTVECDARPSAARAQLARVLGPPTLEVESGGTWVDPATGEVQAKVHVHYRLTEPTATPEDHARLKRARALATAHVGGDASNKTIVHPLRWPGSWHRKHEPARLARIVGGDPESELDLADALERLDAVAPVGAIRQAPGASAAGSPATARTEELGRADPERRIVLRATP
jgi:hypothetical protein